METIEIEDDVLLRAQSEITSQFGLDSNRNGKCYLEAALDMAAYYKSQARQDSQALKECKANLATQVDAPEYLRQMGSFYTALAEAWTLADSSNRMKLGEAFPEHFYK